MTGRAARLDRLEAAMMASPADRGSYCRNCGGLTIEDALLARNTLKKGGNRMAPDDAENVYAALDAGEPACRRCGGKTLVGALRKRDRTA
jgi:hypothetical protein